MRRILLTLGLILTLVGCDKDVREPGEPRILSPLPQTSADTRSSAPANGLAYFSPNKWT
jgi:hypothetical protein